jgi:hypothetical protein
VTNDPLRIEHHPAAADLWEIVLHFEMGDPTRPRQQFVE